MNLYETHLAVRNTEKSKAFYAEIVGLNFAYHDPKRDIVFLWIGENQVSMLGLWGPDTTYGNPFRQSHLAIAISLPELLAAGERINGLGVRTYNFANAETTEPSVIGWMPSAQLYFRDPDGHFVEFITLLDDEPDPNFAGRSVNGESERRKPEADPSGLEMNLNNRSAVQAFLQIRRHQSVIQCAAAVDGERPEVREGADRKRDQELGGCGPRTMEIPLGRVPGEDENGEARGIGVGGGSEVDLVPKILQE
jgi:lactoylglutathione lyase